MTTDSTLHLLLVDDEPSVLSALGRALRRAFRDTVEVETDTDALRALERVRRQAFDVVVSDFRMPEIDGVSFLSLAGAIRPETVRLILTGSADFATAQRAIQDAGVFRYLTKPWQDAELVAHLGAALDEARTRRERLVLA